MSELRYDPVFGQWTCIAEYRRARPFEYQQFTQRRAGIDCPFCRGNEGVTPPAIAEWSDRRPNPELGTDWLVRVVPNKYPAFDARLKVVENGAPRSSIQSNGDLPGQDQRFQEVIVLSPRHVASLSGLNDAELMTSFHVFQTRIAEYLAKPNIGHICLFLNCRPLAGASIEHVHFQLIATPVCTDQVRARVNRMIQSGDSGDFTLWHDLVAHERASKDRVIDRCEDFLVFCPYASRYSNQIRIAPTGNRPFAQLGREPLQLLAQLCRKWVDGIERCLDDPAYNLIFHLPPTDMSDAPWFVDLVPRFPQAAGFELATECWVNPVSPESAAIQFRQFDDRV